MCIFLDALYVRQSIKMTQTIMHANFPLRYVCKNSKASFIFVPNMIPVMSYEYLSCRLEIQNRSTIKKTNMRVDIIEI